MSMIHLSLIFLYIVQGTDWSLPLSTYLLGTAPFIEMTNLSPVNRLCTTVENQSSIHMGIYFGFSILLQWSICLCLHQKHSPDYCSFLMFWSHVVCPLSLFFLFKLVLAIPGTLHFHMNLKINMQISTPFPKKHAGMSVEIAFNL